MNYAELCQLKALVHRFREALEKEHQARVESYEDFAKKAFTDFVYKPQLNTTRDFYELVETAAQKKKPTNEHP